MNRQQIEDIETNGGLNQREVGAVPKELIRLEVLVEDINPETDEGTGNYSGYVVSAHGWDKYGTFVYLRSKTHRGMRYKQYRWFPKGRDVIVNKWAK